MLLFLMGIDFLTSALIAFLILFFAIVILRIAKKRRQKTSDDSGRFFTYDSFVKNFGKEMVSAAKVYERFKDNGHIDNALGTFDIVYISDTKEKLDSLGDFLRDHCGFKMKPAVKVDDRWEISGDSKPIPVDSENLLYWALALYVKGFEFDCLLDGYGAMMDHRNPEFLEMTPTMEDRYFEAGMQAYDKQDLGAAIINWTLVIKINPEEPNSYYSRAIAKNELHTWKSALSDYDKAIELAPEFVDALVNRAALLDEHDDYQRAIDDYNKAIELDPDNPVAYFNRGNTRLNMGDNKLACIDWKKAKALGADYADERIYEYCRGER